MLKLTNSFYRCLWFTCEKVDKTHVRRISHLNSNRKTCGADCIDIAASSQFHTSAHACAHGHGKKRLKIKIPPLNLNDSKRHKPMTDPLQPTANHVSYGGRFDM